MSLLAAFSAARAPVTTTTDWKSPTVADEVADGVEAWSNETNVLSSNDTYATVLTQGSNLTNLLRATGFDFSEVRGQILGVEVRYEVHWSTGTTPTLRVYLLNVTSQPSKIGGAIPETTDAYLSRGGAADTWGVTIDKDDIKSASFGVGIRGTGSGSSATISVDHIQARVTYSF